MLDKKEILLITPNFVKGLSVDGGVVKEKVSLSWTPEGIGSVLKTVRSAIGRKVYLLVGEPFAYVATLSLPTEKGDASPQEERERVFRLAEKLVPEDLRDASWDYRDISLPGASPSRYVQVVALVASFSRAIVPAIREAGFHIIATLPESCAVATLLSDRKEPIILAYKGEDMFVAGISDGAVLSSVTSLNEIRFESVESVRNFMMERFKITPKTIVFVGTFSERELEQFEREKKDISMEFFEGNAPLGFVQSKTLFGDDGAALSVPLSVPDEPTVPEEDGSEKGASGDVLERFRPHALDERVFSSREANEGNAPTRISRRTRIFAAIFVCLFVCGGGMIFFIQKHRTEEAQTTEVPQVEEERTLPAIENIPSQVAEESQDPPESVNEEVTGFNRASFRIVIENGSGLSGAAGRFETFLSRENFVVTGVRNAEESLDRSFLRAKASVSDVFLDELVSVSGLNVSAERRRDISENDEADVILVLGKEITIP